MTKDCLMYACPWRDTDACPKWIRYGSDVLTETISCHAGPLYFKGTFDSVCYVSLDSNQSEIERNTALADFPNRFDWIGTNKED